MNARRIKCASRACSCPFSLRASRHRAAALCRTTSRPFPAAVTRQNPSHTRCPPHPHGRRDLSHPALELVCPLNPCWAVSALIGHWRWSCPSATALPWARGRSSPWGLGKQRGWPLGNPSRDWPLEGSPVPSGPAVPKAVIASVLVPPSPQLCFPVSVRGCLHPLACSPPP
jgi:hypothetical protein